MDDWNGWGYLTFLCERKIPFDCMTRRLDMHETVDSKEPTHNWNKCNKDKKIVLNVS